MFLRSETLTIDYFITMTIKLYLLFRPNHLKRLVYTKDEICVKVSYYYYYYYMSE